MNIQHICLVLAIATTVLFTVFVYQNASALQTGFVNGVYTVFCDQMCFDLVKNSATKGYDPDFLKIQKVKQTCIDSKEYGKGMGFCGFV